MCVVFMIINDGHTTSPLHRPPPSTPHTYVSFSCTPSIQVYLHVSTIIDKNLLIVAVGLRPTHDESHLEILVTLNKEAWQV